MSERCTILFRGAAALVMIAALGFLTTANFWAYGMKKEKQACASSPAPIEEESGSKTPVPNPVEEKSNNSLQNLSEYLHSGHHVLDHPQAVHSFGNRHDIINYPVQHRELVVPPPKMA